MSGRATPPAPQIAACRQQMAALCANWRAISARSEPKARAAAEAQVFNQMAVALQGWCAQRLPGEAGANDTPLTEVRLLAHGISANGGHFPSDSVTRWRPEASVTGYRPGDRIALSEAVFLRLTTACLDALTAKFAEA